MNKLEAIFYSKVRAEVFRLLFGLSQESMYLAEIEHITKFANRSIQEELTKLKKLDLVITTSDRSRTYYSANQSHPLYPDIRNIVLKTSGLSDVLRASLPADRIEFAFVFGSLAARNERAESDVDLMIIGPVTHREIASPLRALNDLLGRELNPHFFSRSEFLNRLAARDHFLNDVISKPKLFIIGDEHELTELIKLQLASTP